MSKHESRGASPQKAREPEEEQDTFRVVDRRSFSKLPATSPEGEASSDVPEPRYPTYVEELRGRLAETERNFEERKRLFEEEIGKMKSRLEADFERHLEMEKQKFLVPFLDVLDNLERALESADAQESGLLKGVEMTANLFRAQLRSEKVEAIEVLEQPFDPELATAVGVVEVDDESRDGVVVEELQRGYRMDELLLRPAQVRVGKWVRAARTS